MEWFKRWINRLGRVILALYALFCALMVYGMTTNKYEWMMHDNPAEPIKFCALPIDGDGALGFMLLTVPLIVGLALAATYLSLKRKKLHFYVWVTLALVVLCLAKVFQCRIGL